MAGEGTAILTKPNLQKTGSPTGMTRKHFMGMVLFGGAAAAAGLTSLSCPKNPDEQLKSFYPLASEERIAYLQKVATQYKLDAGEIKAISAICENLTQKGIKDLKEDGVLDFLVVFKSDLKNPDTRLAEFTRRIDRMNKDTFFPKDARDRFMESDITQKEILSEFARLPKKESALGFKKEDLIAKLQGYERNKGPDFGV